MTGAAEITLVGIRPKGQQIAHAHDAQVLAGRCHRLGVSFWHQQSHDLLPQEKDCRSQNHTGTDHQPSPLTDALGDTRLTVSAVVLRHEHCQSGNAAVPEGQNEIVHTARRRKCGHRRRTHGVDGALHQQLAQVQAGLLQGGHGAVTAGLEETALFQHPVLSGQAELGEGFV